MKLKRILAVGTAMLGVSAFVPTPIVQKCVSLVFADESELTSGDFIYRVNKNTNYDWSTGESTTREYVSILRLTDSAEGGDIVFPDEIDGINVETIDFEGILHGRDDITSLTFPKYLVSAYNCFAIPESCEIKVTEDCENFKVEGGFLLCNQEFFDYSTYQNKKGLSILRALQPLSGEVTVPEGVVNPGSFAGNHDITVINLPSTIQAIDWYFCSGMPSLTAINVSADNPTYFSYHGALGKYYNTYYDGDGNRLETPAKEKVILAVPEGYEGVYRVPDGEALTFTGISFENVSKMTGVELGKDTTFNCAGFQGCTSLETIELNGRVNSVSGIEKYRSGHWDSEKGDWVEDEEITSYNNAEWMFKDTKWYQNQPDGVLYCGATVIGYKGDPNYDKLDIKEGTRTIVDKAFNGLDIGEVNVPASVEYIGAYALDCPRLTAVNIDKDNKTYLSDNGVVYDKDKTMLKLYPQAKADSTYTVLDGTQIVAANAFDGNKYIKHVDIPDSVNCIFGWGSYGGAFKNCSALEDINVPNGQFNTGAVYNDSLKVIDLSESVTSYSGEYDDCDCDYLIFRNPQCEIRGMNNVKLIVGLDGSNAKAFAEEHTIPFMLLEDYEAEQATATTTTATTTTQTTTTTTATTAASTSSTAQPSTTSTAASTTAQPTTTTTTSSSALDSRFVGKWELYKYEVDGAYTSLKPDGFELFANGEGKWSSGGRILWTVVDEFLYIEANNGDLPININRYKYINGELLWSGWTQVVDDNIAPETEKYAMNFYGKSENIYFRRVEDSEQTTTVTTATSQPITTNTTTTEQSTTTTQTTTAQTTTASASTTAPVTTTPEGGNPDKPDMSNFFGSWISYKLENRGQPSDIPEAEAWQIVIAKDKTGRMAADEKAADLTWTPAENGKKMTITVDGDTVDIAIVGGELVLYYTEGKAMYFRHGEKPVDFGDPNNDKKIDSKDASFVLMQYAKMSTGGEAALTEAEKAAADINKDGKVDAKDASLTLAYYSHLSTGGELSLEDFLKSREQSA